MGSFAGSGAKKPHAVCIPYPAQGHINPMFKLAKLLHGKGFHITFVNTEYNHNRLIKSRGPHALDGFPGFRFETIPDGLPKTDADATQDIPALCDSTMKNCLAPFKRLLHRLNEESSLNGGDFPPVSCVVSDGVMSFAVDAAEELGVPDVFFWTTSACGFLCYLHYDRLVKDGLVPPKDEDFLTNGYLDTVIDSLPCIRNIRLKDFPSFIRTTDPNDIMLNFLLHESRRAARATAIILNTFDALEHDVIHHALSSILPCPVYSVGPLQLLVNHQIDEDSEIGRMGSNLWKEETECMSWLDKQKPNDVIYVNFGSIAVLSGKQLVEFAWGLANSQKHFLWVIRPDLVSGDGAVLPAEFLEETEGRGILPGWCPQEKVLAHPAVGGFLTHSGWNSTLESICGGVPMLCWPFFAEQTTNSKYCRDEWSIGMEIGGEVGREEVERLVREIMDGEKGKVMREKAAEWKRMAVEAAAPPNGSSFLNFEAVVSKVLLSNYEKAHRG